MRKKYNLDKVSLAEVLRSKDVDYWETPLHVFIRMSFSHYLFSGSGETLIRNYMGERGWRSVDAYHAFLEEVLNERIRSIEEVDKREVYAYPAENDVFEEACKEEMKRKIECVLKTLPARVADVIRMRFGVSGEEEKTLEEVAIALKVSRERARQIEIYGLRELRRPYRRKFLNFL